MSKQHDTDTHLDAAIDRAVRQMMAIDPPAGFRQRVVARLDRPVAAVAWWPRLALAGGALAAVVLAVVLLRPAPAPVPTAIDGQAPSGPSQVASTPAPAAEATPPAVAPTQRRGVDRPRVETLPPPPRMDTVFGPARDGRVAAADATATAPPSALPAPEAADLPALPPIEIPTIDVPPIEIKPLMLMPLTPAPVNKGQGSL
jgi:hypothetical protein